MVSLCLYFLQLILYIVMLISLIYLKCDRLVVMIGG